MTEKKQQERQLEVVQREFGRSEVDDIIERFRHSENEALRKSHLIGFDVFSNQNLALLYDELRHNHLLLVGAARCGKTAFIARYADQRIRRNEGPLIVIDLKGDNELMHSVRLGAHALGRPFFLNTNVPYFPTRIFNALDQSIFPG